MYGSKMSFPHTCNVLQGTTARNDAGQKFTSWTNTNIDVPCDVAQSRADSRRADSRVVPTVEDADMFSIIFAKVIFDDLDITYASRLADIKDRRGNLIFEGQFKVNLIQKIMSVNGYVTEVRVVVKGAVEDD